MAFVLDASVALAWVLPDETSAAADLVLTRLTEEGSVVPEVWPLEVANALLTARRRGRLALAEVGRAVAALRMLPLEVDTETHRKALSEMLEVATARDLSAYDAAYLELARRRELPLATLDLRLRAACRATGVEVI
jgi:predicted nucleic acid-binding protein